MESNRSTLGQAAYDYARWTAPDVWSVTVAAADAAAFVREQDPDATSDQVYSAVAWSAVDGARDAAVDAVSDAVAATFAAVAERIGAAVGAGDADYIYVGWSDDSDAAEAVGFVVPVVATWGDAFGIVDAYGSPTWADDLATALVDAVADDQARHG